MHMHLQIFKQSLEGLRKEERKAKILERKAENKIKKEKRMVDAAAHKAKQEVRKASGEENVSSESEVSEDEEDVNE